MSGRSERLVVRAMIDDMPAGELPAIVADVAAGLDTGAADNEITLGGLGADVEMLAELIRGLALAMAKR